MKQFSASGSDFPKEDVACRTPLGLVESGAAHRRPWQWLRARLAISASNGIFSWFRELIWPTQASAAYAALALFTLAVPWVHRYPVGIDLPMHANLFQVLAHYSDPEMPYRVFYRLDFFTPYAVVYLLGWFFAEIGGALFAVKVLLSLCILMVPATMTRWLRVIGGDTRLGLLGFALVFGYGYQWGFLSFVLSGAVSFAYLAELGVLLRQPSWKGRAGCAALALLLFFTHGIGFGFTMVAGGLICLLRRQKVRTIALDLLHFLPAALVVIPWRLHQHAATSRPWEALPNKDRFVTLFAGALSSQEDFLPALIALAAVSAFAIAFRPRINPAPERVLPWALGLLGLFAVPESVSDTFLVGTRFVQFVYFFGVGAVDLPEQWAARRRVLAMATALALLGVGAFHYRMAVYNRELQGLDEIRSHVPEGTDVHFRPGDTDSTTFGSIGHRLVLAYIPANQGGLSDPDNTQYFQIPVQLRRDVPRPGQYPNWLTRGNVSWARREMGRDARHVASSGPFHLFEPSLISLEIPGLSFVRFGQNWMRPMQDRAVSGGPLRVGGRLYERGIGTHAQSVFQFHPRPDVKRLRGKVGMDDGGYVKASALFRIFDGQRRKLFEQVVRHGEAAVPFDVSLEGIAGDVYLVIGSYGDIAGAHADWLDLQAAP